MNGLTRIPLYVSFFKRRILLNALFKFQLSYSPPEWIRTRHSWILNSEIDTLHERCLRTIYIDKQSTIQYI